MAQSADRVANKSIAAAMPILVDICICVIFISRATVTSVDEKVCLYIAYAG